MLRNIPTVPVEFSDKISKSVNGEYGSYLWLDVSEECFRNLRKYQ